jgi:hypothetical protein
VLDLIAAAVIQRLRRVRRKNVERPSRSAEIYGPDDGLLRRVPLDEEGK